MPAAMVILAPIAYIKVVAVKMLVVGFQNGQAGLLRSVYWLAARPLRVPVCSLLYLARNYRHVLKKLKGSKEAIA